MSLILPSDMGSSKQKIALKTAIKRPLLHYVIIWGYILAPGANIFFYARTHQITLPALVQNLFTVFSPLAAILLITEPFVGVGLFFIHRVSWYAFVLHSTLVLSDNILKLWTTQGAYQWTVLTSSAVWLALIAYVLQRDFRSPYFQALPRTWREKKRVPIHHYIWLDGAQREINDLSATGCFVVASTLKANLGDRLPVHFKLENEGIDFSCTGEVVRIDEAGYGIRFLNIAPTHRGPLKNFFKHKFPLRYAVNLPCRWHDGRELGARTVDISAAGCFFAGDITYLKPNIGGTLHVTVASEIISIPGKIIWINDGTFIKPLGAGIEFEKPQHKLMQAIHKLHPELQLTR